MLLQIDKGVTTYVIRQSEKGFSVEQESPLTRPAWDRAGIDGPYYKHVAGPFDQKVVNQNFFIYLKRDTASLLLQRK